MNDITDRLNRWPWPGCPLPSEAMEDIVDAREEIRRLKDQIPKWRPIATVPKDGTLILLALPHRPDDPTKGGYLFDVAAWDDEDWKGWRGEDSLWQPDLPTHWMPLPEAPKDLP